MSSPKNLAVPSLITVCAVAVVIGGIYIFRVIQKNERSADALIQSATLRARAGAGRPVEVIMAELATAKANLQIETARLNELRKSSSAESAFQVAIRSQYGTAEDAILKRADSLFANPGSSDPRVKLGNQTASVQAKLNASRLAITSTLNAWKNLASSPTQNSTTVAQSQNYANTLQSYLNQLQQAVSALTPANSGLSQAEIDAYNQAVTQAQNEMATVISTLATTQTPPTTNTPANPSTPSTPSNQQEVQVQETVVVQAQEQVNNLEQELTNTTNPPSPTSGTTDPTPPTQQIPGPGGGPLINIVTQPINPQNATSGKPKLIQGANFDY